MADLESILESEDVGSAEMNERIILMKKKIQLSESQRKAQYEEYESQKKKNTEEIRRLKKAIKEKTVARPLQIDENIVKNSGVPKQELDYFLKKTREDAFRVLDLKIIDGQKRIDLIKYKTAELKKKLADVRVQLEDHLVATDPETNKKYNAPYEKEISRLENKIHLVNVNILEMRHMQKKYLKMRQSLRDDRVYFESTLKKYEAELAKQKAEIKRLQGVKEEAVKLRDKARKALAKLEAEGIAKGLQREAELQAMRREVEESRATLEKVERKLVPSTVKTVTHHDSLELELEVDNRDELNKDLIEQNIARLKQVTGAKDEVEIIDKFKTQAETKRRLVKLKEVVEIEKKDLEKKKEKLESELESIRFAQVKEKEQNEEDLERLTNELQEAQAARDQEEKDLEEERGHLETFKQFYYELCSSIKDVTDCAIPPYSDHHEEVAELVQVTMDKVEAIIKFVDENNLMDDILHEQLSEDECLWVEDPYAAKKPENEKESDKEETVDVPTRSFLKRQSQLIVEAKTKKKGYPRDSGFPSSYK
ncbi:coiled-coil domain containing protein 151 [Rhodnius prolixus]|uniref:coiled-coil domain containing protein 151 n=1 Tax=Rhodnius prolixus TaxID=13249 RepID=UPI003D18E175